MASAVQIGLRWGLAGRVFYSRMVLGTARYPSHQVLLDAPEATDLEAGAWGVAVVTAVMRGPDPAAARLDLAARLAA